MLVELHLLTPHAPSNLNRDDFGRPKTAHFGGTERGRISSQALKRAIRKSPYVAERLGEKISTRSLHIPLLIYNDLKNDYEGDDDKLERLGIVCEAVGNGLGKTEQADGDESGFELKNKQIVFLTSDEIDRLKEFVREIVESDQKLVKKASKKSDALDVASIGKIVAERTGINERPSDGVDVALFGRMTTDEANAFAAVDASMQVAHPIATHTTVTETDYFTAVDDWKQDTAERGSGHIGELDFNSAVYYKYFSCDLDLLTANLGRDREAALEALEVVFDAACRVTPTGKQNSFASHSPAEAALLVLRERKTPCSLAAAFERPVSASEEGYTERSLRRMVERYCRLAVRYELDDAAALFTVEDFAPILGGDGLQTCADGIERAEKLSDLWAFLRSHTEAGASGQPAVATA